MSERRPPRERLLEAMEKQRAATPGIVQEVFLMEIADILEEILDATKLSTAHGVLKGQQLTVGAAITELNPGNTVTMPWKGLTLYDDGPAPLFIAINQDYFDVTATQGQAPAYTPVNVGQPFSVDMGRDQIWKILLTTTNPVSGVSGGNASIRLFSVK
jgi:hypothetical protein